MKMPKRRLWLAAALVITMAVIVVAVLDQAMPPRSAFGMTIELDGPSPKPVDDCEEFVSLDTPGNIVVPATSNERDSPEEITVLTYNTHLFGGSQVCDVAPDTCYQDETRADGIIGKIRASGADIVALQEIWEQPPYETHGNWQDGFVSALSQDYPYAWYANGCTEQPLMIGSGLVLLSKWPLQDLSFTKFPVYDFSILPKDSDYWATKGVIAATVLLGNNQRPIRVGISHALTGGDDDKSKWDDAYVGTAITPFRLNGQPYVFSLKSDSNQAYVTRIEDYGYYDDDTGAYKYGAGYKDLFMGSWSSNYVAIESFELNGHPWLFGLKGSPYDEAWFTRINDDPTTGWTDFKKVSWDSSYNGTTITSFELNEKPYIFGLKTTYNQAWFSRINADPVTGNIDMANPYTDFGPYTWNRNYVAVESFELNGQPWLFALKGEPYNEAWFSRINADPVTGDINPSNPYTDFGPYNWDSSYNGTAITSFQLDGQPYIFGLKTTWDQAWISRIRFNPGTQQIEFDDFEFAWNRDYVAIKAFEMNGQPYLWALKDCCSQYPNACAESRPGELYITRIYEVDDVVHIEDVNQLEDMKLIRDATVRDDLPAIMMGDFNVHKSKYGFMDNIFDKAGAVDAYIAVHGTGDGGETIDRDNNNLDQIFSGDDPCNGHESCFDRIDYVYVKQAGDGIRLVPTEARVIRDWKYDDPSTPGTIPIRDLSDHYPLIVTFEITAEPVADFDADPRSGPFPLAVSFTDLSSGGPTSWAWDFDDGGASIEQHPTHVYTATGSYTVTLTVSNDLGSDTRTEQNYIVVTRPEPPVAAFSASPEVGTVPLTVTFTDQSSGNPTIWAWGFGDGGASIEQHPTHVYTATGSYTVTLTVSNDLGSDTRTEQNYIVVTRPEPPVADPCVMTRCIPEPENPDKCLGQPCMPGDEPPRPGLTCQVSGGWCQAPAAIANAQKGDVILSGECDLIGGLLSRLSPPQRYTHSGIMTRDHYEIRHSTSSEERIDDHRAGLGGMDGIEESVLRYGWPGVITQEVDQAFNGQGLTDPDGKEYWIARFRADPGRCDGETELIWPRVVKPPPGALPAVRDKLREAADMALASEGHYRFFAYTDGAIVGDGAYNAPPAPFWAAGSPATVCSQFIWDSLKKVGVQLEGTCLEQDDIARGAERDASTADGLYLYRPDERLASGTWLYETIYHQAYAECADILGDVLCSRIAARYGNQFANCFANDDCTPSNQSLAWKDAEVGRTVSPDDILFWDGPTPDPEDPCSEIETVSGVYGTSEPLVYRGGDIVARTTWQPSEGVGAIAGQVRYLGYPVAHAAVDIAGFTLFTNVAGRFYEPLIPAGTYELVASTLLEGNYLSARRTVEITAGEQTNIQIMLQPPPPSMRRVEIEGSIYIVDDEFGEDETGEFDFYEARSLDVFQRDVIVEIKRCVGDEVRAELRFHLHLQEADDTTVTIGRVQADGQYAHAWLYEGTTCKTDDLEAWLWWHPPGNPSAVLEVPAGGEQHLSGYLENQEFLSPDSAEFDFTIRNVSQTFPPGEGSGILIDDQIYLPIMLASGKK